MNEPAEPDRLSSAAEGRRPAAQRRRAHGRTASERGAAANETFGIAQRGAAAPEGADRPRARLGPPLRAEHSSAEGRRPEAKRVVETVRPKTPSARAQAAVTA